MSSVILKALAVGFLVFILLGVILSIGADIQGRIQATQTASSLPYNITQKALEGTENVGDQLPLMGTIMAFGAIVSMLVAYFWFRGKGAF